MNRTLNDLDTPAVVVDRGRLEANLDRVAGIAAAHGIRLRPHAKTHKCAQIAGLQLARGAVGLTCAKVGEALYWLEEGLDSITIAYPLIGPEKVKAVLGAAKRSGAELRLTADSEVGVEVIDEAAATLGVTADVFLKIDVGFHRCGVALDDPRLGLLAGEIDSRASLRFAGILSHAGHAYAVGTAEDVQRIAEEERSTMVAARDALRSRGIEVPEVSVGSTPTVLACRDFDGITEVRPGNYVFMDRTPLRLGLVEPEGVSLFVVATVVSRNDDYLIVDAGSKVLSSDGGGHGFKGVDGFGLAWPLSAAGPKGAMKVAKLSEEHGWVAREGRDLPLGTRVRILPNHSCVIANLTEELTVCDSQGRITDTWRVGARGRVR